jgi:hypothetical protein
MKSSLGIGDVIIAVVKEALPNMALKIRHRQGSHRSNMPGNTSAERDEHSLRRKCCSHH